MVFDVTREVVYQETVTITAPNRRAAERTAAEHWAPKRSRLRETKWRAEQRDQTQTGEPS